MKQNLGFFHGQNKILNPDIAVLPESINGLGEFGRILEKEQTFISVLLIDGFHLETIGNKPNK
jgi:hypothetical protein